MKTIIIVICILALAGYVLSVKAPQTWNSIASSVSDGSWSKDSNKKTGEVWQKANQWLKLKDRNINIDSCKERAGKYIKDFLGQNLSPK